MHDLPQLDIRWTRPLRPLARKDSLAGLFVISVNAVALLVCLGRTHLEFEANQRIALARSQALATQAHLRQLDEMNSFSGVGLPLRRLEYAFDAPVRH